MATKTAKIEIGMVLKITPNERTYLRSVLYSELKRLTDLKDHAVSHGDVAYTPNRLTTIEHLIHQFEYGQ